MADTQRAAPAMSSIAHEEAGSLAHQMGIDHREIRRRLEYVGVNDRDRTHLHALMGFIERRSEFFADAFFDHLRTLDNTSGLVENPALLAQARRLKTTHLAAMVAGEYGVDYVNERLQMGLLYSQAGLDPQSFLGAFHHMLNTIGVSAVEYFQDEHVTRYESYSSLMKIAFFDIGLIIDTLIYERERTIRQQAEAIRQLSSPLLTLGKGLLILPLIGQVDAERAAGITDLLLSTIRRQRIRAVVVDITGVPMVDMEMSRNFVHMVRTSEMMGAKVVLTGLSEDVSRSMVELGANLHDIDTYGSLQDGVDALRKITG